MAAPTILFTTKTYYRDFHHFLCGAFERKRDACQYPFTESWLMINNGVPDDVVFPGIKTIKTQDYATEALNHFGLTEADFVEDGHDGYYYSIAELVELYLAKDFDYLCHFSGDALLDKPGDWITPGIAALEHDPNVAVVSPYSEVNTYGELDHEFSDQSYLVRVPEFREKIFGLREPKLENYPEYGANSFERQLGRYLHQTGRFRRILFDFYVHHPIY